MTKSRFFATLHFAKNVNTPEKALRHLLIQSFFCAFTIGWESRVKPIDK